MHIQDFRNISSLVIFRLSSCDSSPPLRLIVGGSSKVHRMSYTHPNSIPSIAMSSLRQEEEMGKNPFWYFGPTNYDLSTSIPKSSNSNILVSAHPIGKMKIALETLRSREDMVKNPFFDFECFTSRNPCDSSTSPKANFWPRTSGKFLKHGFPFFHPNLPFSLKSWSKWHIGFLI